MADVFISYKREDSARIAPLIGLIEGAGYSVWWDQGIEPGDEWFARILDELDRSQLTLGIWSGASLDARGLFVPNAQNKYYVRIEHDRTRPGRLIPVQLDADRIALEYSHLHAVSLVGWGGASSDPRCAQLIARMRRLLGAPDPLPASPFQGEEQAGASRTPRAGRIGGGRKPGDTFRDLIPLRRSDTCPEMVIIPSGKFLMGAPAGEEGSSDAERPQREVRIDYTFALGKYPVTFAEWDAALAAGAKLEKPGDRWGRDRRPVIHVSWNDAKAYIAWLNAELGLDGRVDAYRLPSEAEWEYACRAGTTTPFSFGATISTAQANYQGNDANGAGQKGEFRQQTTPVGSFPANAFGLHDMHGNVWEWCEDAWHDNYAGAPADGSAWIAGGDAWRRVLRGGSWDYDADWLRSAARLWEATLNGLDRWGFRLARTLSNP